MSRRIYVITLRAASRQVGRSRFTRGQSFTLPITEDVEAYKRQPAIWDVKITSVGRERHAEPGTKAAPVSPAASSAFTGLVNRLDAAAEATARLSPEDRGALVVMVTGHAPGLATRLARALGLEEARELEAAISAPGELAHALELALERIALLEAELDQTSAKLDALTAELVTVPTPEEVRAAAALLSEERAEAARQGLTSELSPEEVEELHQAAASTPQGEAPDSSELEASPAVPTPMEELQAALVALQAGDESVTMAQARKLAAAAGLELPAEVHKIRRRDELATTLAQLIAASATTDHPSPADL